MKWIEIQALKTTIIYQIAPLVNLQVSCFMTSRKIWSCSRHAADFTFVCLRNALSHCYI